MQLLLGLTFKKETLKYIFLTYISHIISITLQGYIRFDEDGGAKKAYEGAMANVPTGEACKICDSDVTLKVLEGLSIVSI